MRTWMAVAACILTLSAQESFSPKPTAHHLAMKDQAGTWKATAKMYFDPAKPPVVSTGTETNTLVAGGLWLRSELKAEMMGQPYEGHGLFGYDTLQHAHVGTWVDNAGTWMALIKGTCDQDCRVQTLFFEAIDEAGKPTPQKEVHTQVDKDHRTLVMYTKAPDGTFVKTMEMAYTRTK